LKKHFYDGLHSPIREHFYESVYTSYVLYITWRNTLCTPSICNLSDNKLCCGWNKPTGRNDIKRETEGVHDTQKECGFVPTNFCLSKSWENTWFYLWKPMSIIYSIHKVLFEVLVALFDHSKTSLICLLILIIWGLNLTQRWLQQPLLPPSTTSLSVHWTTSLPKHLQ
jgi:hypothetical protein